MGTKARRAAAPPEGRRSECPCGTLPRSLAAQSARADNPERDECRANEWKHLFDLRFNEMFVKPYLGDPKAGGLESFFGPSSLGVTLLPIWTRVDVPHGFSSLWENLGAAETTSAAPARFCPTLGPRRELALLAVAGLLLRSQAGRGAKVSLVAPPTLTQHKVVVGGGAHGVKHVRLVWDLEL